MWLLYTNAENMSLWLIAAGGSRQKARPCQVTCALQEQVFYWLANYLPKRMQMRAAAMKQKDMEKDLNPNTLATGEAASLEHKHARHITRVSLRLLMPTAKSVFAKLFKQLEVVEPTYKDNILLYRYATIVAATSLPFFECRLPSLKAHQTRWQAHGQPGPGSCP
jgi:hypothetical protein